MLEAASISCRPSTQNHCRSVVVQFAAIAAVAAVPVGLLVGVVVSLTSYRIDPCPVLASLDPSEKETYFVDCHPNSFRF